jgi:hypothetical protein
MASRWSVKTLKPGQWWVRMLIYLQMLWKIEGRLSFDQVWKMEVEESYGCTRKLQDNRHV